MEQTTGDQDLIPVKDVSEIPAFASNAEEAEFWRTHSLSAELLGKLHRLTQAEKEERFSRPRKPEST